MDEYLIGAGALLTAGPNATITGATLHAQADPALARQIAGALIDFESANADELSRILIVAAGWSAARFQDEVVAALLSRRECALADIIVTLAQAVGTGEIHLFAHWQPSAAVLGLLEKSAVRLVCHPLDAIGQASLVSGQRVARWRPVRAA
jgi:hypothetical protein